MIILILFSLIMKLNNFTRNNNNDLIVNNARKTHFSLRILKKKILISWPL